MCAATNTSDARFVVEEAIECGRGKVRVGDTLWSVEGSDAPVGASVTVTGARGTALVVERAPARMPPL